MERVYHSINKIFREILCITIHEKITYITIRGRDQDQVSAFSSTPQYRTVLSWDLLVWISTEDRIPTSFTNFITTPELSGPLFISPDIYHTQITEYLLQTICQWALSICIEHLPNCYSVRCDRFLNSDWFLIEHLYRALPTEMIFNLLRSIRAESLIHARSAELMLEIISLWIQVSVSECNWQTSD